MINVQLGDLCGTLFAAKNRFMRAVWQSNQKDTLRLRDGDGNINPYWGDTVEKRYDCVIRNDFSYENRVRRLADKREVEHQHWSPQPPTWGSRFWGDLPVFFWHIHKTDGLQLYVNGMPINYNNTEETGYYLNGVKATPEQCATINQFKKPRRQPEMPLDGVRFDSKPVRFRLSNVLRMIIDGETYALEAPDDVVLFNTWANINNYAVMVAAA